MTRLCRFEDIPDGEARGFEVAGVALVAVKKQGRLYLYHNRCPHRGINLEWMPDGFLDTQRQFIQCATHGALFLIESGSCIQGPCLGSRLQAVEYSLKGDEVMVGPEALSRSAPAVV